MPLCLPWVSESSPDPTVLTSTSHQFVPSQHLATTPTLPSTRQVLPAYPGEEDSLSFNSEIVLDGLTPHIREIYFAGESDTTYQGGDIVQVSRAFALKL